MLPFASNAQRAAICAALSCIPQAALAQDAVTPHLDLALDVALRYDSNVAHSDAARAAVRGLERADQRVTPTVSIDILQTFGRNSVTLVGAAGYDFYRRNHSLNRERLAIESGASLALAFCTLDLSAGASRRQSDLGEIGFVATNDVTNAETTQNYGATLGCGRSIGLYPTISVERSIGDNSNVARQLADYRTMRYTAGLGYRHPSIGNLTVFATRANTDYPNRPLGTTTDGYQLTSFGGRFDRAIGSRMRGSIEVAHVKLDPERIGTSGFSGLTWNAELTATVTPQLQLHGNVGRSTNTTLTTDSAYHIDKIYAADATYAINERLSFKAGYSVAPSRYVYSGPVVAPTLERDKRHLAFGNLTYSRSARLKFTLDVGNERRNANGSIFDYKNTFAMLGVRTQF